MMHALVGTTTEQSQSITRQCVNGTNKAYQSYHIPCICHQTFQTKNLPEDLQQLMSRNKDNNPKMIFKMYDDDDIDLYIKTHFVDRVYRCYNAINSKYGASRADFFRYCVLYLEGGVYVDIKTALTKDVFKDVVRPNDVAILDRQRCDLAPWRHLQYSQILMPTWEQWVLLFAPRHDYMRRAIQRICDEIEDHCSSINDTAFTTSVFSSVSNQLYNTTDAKEKVLRLTGPDGLANSIQASILANGINHRSVDIESFTSRVAVAHKQFYRPGQHYSEQTEPLLLCPE